MFKIESRVLARQMSSAGRKQFVRYSSTSRPNSNSQEKKTPASSKTTGGKNATKKADSSKHQTAEKAVKGAAKQKEGKEIQKRVNSDKRHQGAIKADYSWLPKAPKLASYSQRELRLQMLFSGYRPLFLKYRKALQPEKTSQVVIQKTLSPLSYSAAGTEYRPEWENVPPAVLAKIKPFDQELDQDFQEAMKKYNQASLPKTKLQTKSAPLSTKGRKRNSSKFMQTLKENEDKKLELRRLLRKVKEKKNTENGE